MASTSSKVICSDDEEEGDIDDIIVDDEDDHDSNDSIGYENDEPLLRDDDLIDDTNVVLNGRDAASSTSPRDENNVNEEDSIRDIDIEIKKRSIIVQNLFTGGIVKWKGSRNARYVVLTDTPKKEDLKRGELDSSGKIWEKFTEIIESLPGEHRGDLAVISCLVGWHKDHRKEGTPHADELEVSAPYIERLLMQMPNVQVIIALGQYATELCFRRFDVYDMYAKSRKKGKLTAVDAPSPTMFLRRTYDKFYTTVVQNERVLRYMHAPALHNKNFEAFVRGCLYKVPTLQQFKIEHKNFDVRGPELQFPPEAVDRCIDYRQFKERLYDRLRTEREDGVRSIFNDASRDPYMQMGNRDTPVLVYDVEYDPVRNLMYMHTATPSGSALRVTVNNLAFTFWIRPHVAYALEGAHKWFNRSSQRPLLQEHLKPLEKYLSRKLFYCVNERKQYAFTSNKVIAAVPTIKLFVDNEKDDNFDGQWKNDKATDDNDEPKNKRLTSFIRCEVNNYAYIEHIRAKLIELYKKYTSKRPKGKVEEETPLEEFYDDRMDVYDVFTAEKMFINRYNVRMSHWYRIKNLQVDMPRPVSHKHNVKHALYLSARLTLPQHHNPLECLSPDKSIDLGYNGMTSSDMPEDVRGSFDIEVSKFGKNYGTSLDSPIICICAVVRRHDNKSTKLEKGTCVPVEGYEYFGFFLGNVQEHRDDSELRGKENIFMFTSERELLRAYYKFYDLLKPRYYASHNGKSYDHQFCMSRASVIGCKKRVLGYVPDMTVRMVQRQFDSKAFGERTVTSYDGEKGIAQMDTLEIFMREKKLDSYRLGFLAKEFVGMTKSDMPYNAIMGHWKESDWSRRVLLDYCYRDSQLPDQILSQGQWIVNANEMARANGSVAECVMHEKGVTEKILGAYAQANTTIGDRYLIRTNNYVIKQENSAITERWIEKEEYSKQPSFDAFGKEGSTDGSRVVATIDNKRKLSDALPDSFKPSSSRDTLPRNKRPPPNKKARVQAASSSSSSSSQQAITSFFRKVKPLINPERKFDDELETPVHIPGLNISEEEKRRNALVALARAKIDNNGGKANRKAEYQGAVVMDAMLGWHYKLPLGCMDFASLYPSIMMAYNMGSNTKVYGDELTLRGYTLDDVYEPAPSLEVLNPRTNKKVRLFFLKEHICKGILSMMENNLVRLRNVAKVLIDPYGHEFLEDNVTPNPRYNPTMSAIMKCRSDGLKVMANSGYGATGAEGLLCDKDVAAAVTACGRESITLVRNKTSELTGAICRGGDTDSVFMEFCGLPKGSFDIKWQQVCDEAKRREDANDDSPYELCCPLVPDGWYRCNTVADVEKLADELLMPYLNKFFRRPMKLDYEKAMCRFVAIAKKRYIYFLCVRGQVPKLNYKGIEVVRRDSLPVTKATLKEAFTILQFLRDPNDTDDDDRAKIKAAKRKARKCIRRQGKLLANGQDKTIDEITLSKQRSRETYDNENQEHLTVVRKMEERGLEAAPVGSRVYYVYTHMRAHEDGTPRKGYEIADDPQWVVQNNIPIDWLYYFEHKFKDPIVRIMRFFYDDMVKRIVKRRKEDQRVDDLLCGSSRKRPKRVINEEDITLDDITKETEDYLFGASKKGSYNYKNLQTRYSSLRGSKVAAAHVDKSDKSTVAFYAKNERTRRQHLKIQYETEDDNEILEREMARFEKAHVNYSERLKDCRTCLRLKDNEEVECIAYDCKKFSARTAALGTRKQAVADLEELVSEFNALELKKVVCNDDDDNEDVKK